MFIVAIDVFKYRLVVVIVPGEIWEKLRENINFLPAIASLKIGV